MSLVIARSSGLASRSVGGGFVEVVKRRSVGRLERLYTVQLHQARLRLVARAGRQRGALDVQQRLLAVQAAGVAGQRAVLADDAVARHDDGDRIASYRRAHRARGLRASELAR